MELIAIFKYEKNPFLLKIDLIIVNDHNYNFRKVRSKVKLS